MSTLSLRAAISLGVTSLVIVACGGATAPVIADGGASSSGSSGTSGGSSGSSSGGASSSASSSGSSGTITDSGAPSETRTCRQASDCGWGEIGHEILVKTDCLCLFGCPHLPLNQQTIKRRQEQYDKLCDPRRDGQGRLCPVDDCLPPQAIECRNGLCAPPLPDAGKL